MGYVWRLNDEKDLLKESIAATVGRIRSPAGAKYKTLEEIKKNPNEFGRDFHKGLFRFHLDMINQILHVEDKLRELPKPSTLAQRTSKRGIEHLRQIFRTFNDCIAWTIFLPEPSFTINRLCRRRTRGYLKDQNPESVLRFIVKVSKTGETLAIWNDATRCIDLYDVTAVTLNPRKIDFFELKEGQVNEEIMQLAGKIDTKEIKKGLDRFFAQRGPSGIKQFERFAKQQIEGRKIQDLISKDDLEDPFLKKRRTAITPHKPLESYDSELSLLLREVRDREFAHIAVDGCLHILAVNQARLGNRISIDALIERELKRKIPDSHTDEPDCRTVLLHFQDTLYSPISMPVMLRTFDAIDIADLCIGNLVLFFMFDFNAWGEMLQNCRLTWSSKKRGRREKSKPFLERRLVVDSRVPTITSPSGNCVQLGDRIIPLMACEGIRPVSMAEHYDHLLMHSDEGKDNSSS